MTPTSVGSGTRRRLLLRALRLVADVAKTVVGMSGMRLDRLRAVHGAPWLGLWLASLAGYVALFDPWDLWASIRADREVAIGYVVVAFLVYYGGLVGLLGLSGNRVLIRGLGPRRSSRLFETGLGMAFAHQALAVGAVCFADAGSLRIGVPVWLTSAVGAALAGLGFGVKIWSTRILGLDGYYYRDMFLAARARGGKAELVSHGPYRWVDNPMYGVGNLAAYGAALMHRSLAGLVVAAVAQACIYAFYFRYELPFVRRAHEPAT